MNQHYSIPILFNSDCNIFQAVKTNNDFEIATLKFEDFHQMVDGQINPNEVSLKKNDIKTFGF